LTVTYFSMEVGTRNRIRDYSGGLGILAGDTLKAAADRGLDVAGITLCHQKGFATQDGKEQPWPEKGLRFQDIGLVKLNETVEVPCGDRKIKVGAWLEPVVSSQSRKMVPLYRLTTDVEGNSDEDKTITDRLYNDGKKTEQAIVLGIGGMKMIKALGYSIDTNHMNEGHSCLLILEQLKDCLKAEGNIEDLIKTEVTAKNVFFNHSVVDAAMVKHGWADLSYKLGGEYSSAIRILRQGSRLYDCNNIFETNRVGATFSRDKEMYGVSAQHETVMNERFPGFYVGHVTNGVHPETWVTPRFAALYDKFLGKEWRTDPAVFAKASKIPPFEIWDAHTANKADGFRELNARIGAQLDPSNFTVVFARRAATYKEWCLLLNEITGVMLEKLPHKINYILAGKPHPQDGNGRAMLEEACRVGSRLNTVVNFAFVPEYDMEVAMNLLKVADLWLNHPQHNMEACGTSGMKAALNAIPNASKLEGWWNEMNVIDRVTGWNITEEKVQESAVSAIRSAQEAYHNGHMAKMMPRIVSEIGPFVHIGRMLSQYERIWNGACLTLMHPSRLEQLIGATA
jgi:glycogen phosphorylase